MKDRLKKALKRAASGLMAVLLAVCLVGTPRAKAVVTEGALLGSIFGSLLVSMGYSWAADNMDVPTFGEAIYDLIKECDEEMDTGIQALLDANLAGLTAVGAGKVQFGQQWVQAARSFAEWFYDKFSFSENESVIISSDSTVTDSSGNIYPVLALSAAPPKGLKVGDVMPIPSICTLQDNMSPFTVTFADGSSVTLSQDSPGTGKYTIGYLPQGKYYGLSGSGYTGRSFYFCEYAGQLYLGYHDSNERSSTYGVFWPIDISITSANVSSLTAEKPQEIHYPEVADEAQVYEITVDGVTATDIEGIIQGAVDRILAGSAAIVGSVEQAGTGEIVESPELDSYKVGLSSVFPFCIPFDVYNMVTMFVAEPEAPSAEWSFTLPWSSQEYSVGWDLSDFDGVAAICRNMQLVLFAVGLAVITYRVIKW